MDARVDELERDTSDIKAALARLEISLARVEAQTPYLATKADVERLETSLARVEAQMPYLATKSDIERLTGASNVLTERVSAMEGRLERVTRTVDAKLIGPWQLPAILAACAGVLIAGAALFNWLQSHPWFGIGR